MNVDMDARKKAMRILYGEELSQKDSQLSELNEKHEQYHDKLKQLDGMSDLNTPKARNIIKSLLLL